MNPKLVVYDFDGVMTDNKVILREDGLESVTVNRADGLAVAILKKRGIAQIILSTESNKVVAKRAEKLGIPLIQGISNKRICLTRYCKEKTLLLKDVLYVGNDLNDLDVMRIVGYPVCPSDACKEIKSISMVVLDSAGGEGVVRELLGHIRSVSRRIKNEK